MENMSPSLELAIEMQSSMANGESVRSALIRFASESKTEFSQDVKRFLIAWDQSQDWRSTLSRMTSPYRRALLETAAHGLAGQSIQQAIVELQAEIELACDDEIKMHIEMLPLKMLIPLLLLQFPAFLLVLFGPLMNRFVEELSR